MQLRRRNKLILTMLIVMLLVTVGCAGLKKQTPQYQASIGINDFATTLSAAQETEIGIHNAPTGMISDDLHIQFQTGFQAADRFGRLANAGVKAGDFQSAKANFASAAAALNNLHPAMLGIKDATAQASFNAVLQAAITVASNWATQLSAANPATGTISSTGVKQ